MSDLDNIKTIDKFFENRDNLIIKHMNGEIDKRSFLELNYNYMIDNKIKPFMTIDSFEKGMYNYQFYNVMAKYYKTLVQEQKLNGKGVTFYSKFLDDIKYYYDEKDKTTFRLLRFLKYKNVDAYFIKMESSFLEGKLYEIVLNDYEFAILHSQSEWILNALKKEGVFDTNTKKSVIDYYVNQKY
ncbi:hypothetical protein JYG23_06540 [Sedimentibacter sp. zth1]|uniref:DUF6648 family protein n=1 Tax=Sedimentibacter sp. zth1 TaxID=2816908 RepID=UPI001A9276AD|nr:DUF6648 family protein [Sedimentibacter sp. zth1]QSX07040.1 hypothetical protein JYG23_06540 [Sedimentibacter sp. zth1]